MRAIVVLMLLCAVGAVARADDDVAAEAAENVRPFHGSIAAGSALMFGGADRWAGIAAVDVLPGGVFDRWGLTVGVRDVAYRPSFGARGLATIGVMREAAAARPLLAIFMHGDVGVTWGGERTLPAFGGGVKTYLGIVGPLGVALDSTVHVEIDGVDGTHLIVTLSVMAGLIR
jgi:hypothetical protein